jgi:hypothetical protein
MMKKLNVVFLLATVTLVGGALWLVLRPGRHFDPSLWGNPATSASVRLRMADDLVDNKKLIGLTRQEVVTRLGEPPKTNTSRSSTLSIISDRNAGSSVAIQSGWC